VSEFLASAAAKMGVPEALVRRSAEARAKATGSSTDDVLAAWAGGEAAPAAAPPPAPEPTSEPEPAAETTPEPEPVPAPAAGPTAGTAAAATPGTIEPVAAAPRPATPPILVGREESLAGTMLGAAALLSVSLLVGFVVASTPEQTNLAYTSEYAYSETALRGQELYRSQGCAACHTQVVRPVVADALLGGVSMSDTNQVIGTRRFAPDLAHIGSRVGTDADLYLVLEGSDGHPPFTSLDQSDLDAVVAYLMESA